MHFTFSYNLPVAITTSPTLISGEASMAFHQQEYLIMYGEETRVFEMRHTWSGLPFKEAMLIGDVLIAGHQDQCYIFNIRHNCNLLALEVLGYFGHIYFNDDHFYVTGAYGIFCIDLNGQIIWQNDNIAIDGLYINEFDREYIHVRAQHDPPDGWHSFSLERSTGKLLD